MNKLSKLAACLVLPLCVAGFAPVAQAVATNTTVVVSATVIDSCTVIATPLVFGNYDGIGSSVLDAAATVMPVCTSGTYYSIALDAGLGNGASLTNRKLTGPGGAVLNYGIFTDAGRTIIWGDGTGGTSNNANTGIGSVQSLTMYGRVPAEQSATVGAYVDTITVTLSY